MTLFFRHNSDSNDSEGHQLNEMKKQGLSKISKSFLKLENCDSKVDQFSNKNPNQTHLKEI